MTSIIILERCRGSYKFDCLSYAKVPGLSIIEVTKFFIFIFKIIIFIS